MGHAMRANCTTQLGWLKKACQFQNGYKPELGTVGESDDIPECSKRGLVKGPLHDDNLRVIDATFYLPAHQKTLLLNTNARPSPLPDFLI